MNFIRETKDELKGNVAKMSSCWWDREGGAITTKVETSPVHPCPPCAPTRCINNPHPVLSVAAGLRFRLFWFCKTLTTPPQNKTTNGGNRSRRLRFVRPARVQLLGRGHASHRLAAQATRRKSWGQERGRAFDNQKDQINGSLAARFGRRLRKARGRARIHQRAALRLECLPAPQVKLRSVCCRSSPSDL